MNLDQYTEKLRGFIQAAQTLAARKKHQGLAPIHLFRVMLDDDTGLIPELIQTAGADLDQVTAGADREIANLPAVEGSGANQIYLTRDLTALFDQAEEVAKKAGDSYVTSDRMLQAMTMTKDSKPGQILTQAGVTDKKLNTVINERRKGRTADSANAEDTMDALNKYAMDLTAQARSGKLDPVIGRDEEIRRMMQVLSRRTKNNPVLIGEPGVGKTAIVEGLAQRIINRDVPESLSNKRLLALDLGAMLAGAKYRGEFEERMKAVLDEVKGAAGQIVLFIDEMHTLVGAGQGGEGAMDASNMLKPALARGELHMIGATTLDEFRKHVEKDAALTRRFQPVYVDEPSVEDTISILRGIKEKYDMHHGVRISDSALVSAAQLSDRYISDRFLPDKAIDLIDEAAARLRMAVDSKPEKIDELDRRIVQLKIEKEALKKESDPASKDRLEKVKNELAELEQQSDELTDQWQAEKSKIDTAQQIREKLDDARMELEKVQRTGDWTRAGELSHSVIPQLETELEEAKQVADEAEATRMLQEEVSEDDIATIVSRWTGIPVDKMLQGEREKLLQMEDHLTDRVIGQDQAVEAVSQAVRRARAGLQDPNRPIGSFMFLGPTGVGKTELTKTLAEFLFDDENAMIRLDMSEYMERHAVARLIGAPPGYVGYEEGGALTEAVRRRPYQVILLDEIEKAHKDVFNTLLQVLDDGRLTDGQGRTVDFKNTLIIMTSNLGAEYLVEQSEGESVDEVRDDVMAVVRSHFRPEFLNRLDEIILFNRLERDHMAGIVKIQLKRLEKMLSDHKIDLTQIDAAVDYLADRGYDPAYGARPLKRVIQKDIQNPMSEMMLAGKINDGDTVRITVTEDEVGNDTLAFETLTGQSGEEKAA
jgi:ATP-dependent Clp protease ATP-binding subunit ClpB